MLSKRIVLIIAVLLLFLAACGQQEPREIELKPYPITEFAESDLTAVDKITIKSGETGELKTVTDQQEVTEWMEFIKGIQFTPDLNQEKRTGWVYLITLYEGKKKVLEFYPNYIDDVYFEVEEDVLTEFHEMFRS